MLRLAVCVCSFRTLIRSFNSEKLWIFLESIRLYVCAAIFRFSLEAHFFKPVLSENFVSDVMSIICRRLSDLVNMRLRSCLFSMRSLIRSFVKFFPSDLALPRTKRSFPEGRKEIYLPLF